MHSSRLRVRQLALALGTAAVLFLGAAWISPAAPAAAAPPALGCGCGHDQLLSDADNSLLKAFEQIKNSQNPGVNPPFDGHDLIALRAINRAREELAKAIDFSENSCN